MKYRLLLLLAALIWGCAFVAQRVSTETMGPFAFNGLRFGLGALTLLPFVYRGRGKAAQLEEPPARLSLTLACLTLGFVLFAGAGLQQVGIIYTTAGKAGFITALYIVVVPLAGLLLHNPLRLAHILGCLVAVVGLYFLAVHEELQALNFGDLLELSGVIFWTMHILLISRLVRYYPGVWLAAGQFVACSAFNLLGLLLTGETLTWGSIVQTAWPLLYGGVFSCGVAYTLQVIGQAQVPPTEASLLLSFEMIFSALSGFLLLGEVMTGREFMGCLLMTGGIFMAQLPSRIIWQGVGYKN
jgi:drug/metabolite transporter (DMT)-like permease